MHTVFPLVSHFMVYFITQKMHVFSHQFFITGEKRAKPFEQGKSGECSTFCEVVTHTFPIVKVVFSIRFPSCGILYQMRNAWVSSSISHSMERAGNSMKLEKPEKLIPGKILQNPCMNLANWNSYFSQSMGVFLSFH